MTCYDEYDAVVECVPSQQAELLLWACVALAGLALIFVVLVILGKVHDWVVDRYGRDEDDTTTPPTMNRGPVL